MTRAQERWRSASATPRPMWSRRTGPDGSRGSSLTRQEAEHPHRRPLLLTQEVLQCQQMKRSSSVPGMKLVRARKIRWWREVALGRVAG